MNEEIDRQYLEWLYDLVGRQAKNVEHWLLLKELVSSEFLPMPDAPSDENRSADGIALRWEFIRHDIRLRAPRHWYDMECSVLELMIGIARHLAFEMGEDTGVWFWLMLDNLGLSRYNDRRFHGLQVQRIIERFVWRQYSYNGNGGLFPLNEPHQDQRHVELWFQMESYMLEMS
jgi:hypothetical protein